MRGWGGVRWEGEGVGWRDVVAMRGRETSNDLIYQSEN